MDVEQARTHYQQAQAAFDDAVEATIAAATRQASVELACRRGGLRESDQVCRDTDKAMAQAAQTVWQCRQARDQASDALTQAERDAARTSQSSRWEMQLALVEANHPRLAERYRQELQAVEDAEPGEARDKQNYIAQHTRSEILTYRVSGDAP